MNRIGWLAISALPLSVLACSGAPASTGSGPGLNGSSGVDRGQVATGHPGDDDARKDGGREAREDGGADLDDRGHDAREDGGADLDDDRDGAAEHEDAEVHGNRGGGDGDAAPGQDDHPDADNDQGHGGKGPH